MHHGGALLEDPAEDPVGFYGSTPLAWLRTRHQQLSRLRVSVEEMAKRKATPLDTLPPICAGAVVTSVAMYPVDVVRAICMANPGTGAGEALKGFLEVRSGSMSVIVS